jgi:hypothetical protein
MNHFVSASCTGETCRCGRPATHKVGEEIPSDEPRDLIPGTAFMVQRHNFTAYVCCRCMRRIFGDAVFCPLEGKGDG